jgi:IclR family transcriptional regulator, acetate operon repressor
MKESIGMARVENAPLDRRYGVKSLGRALDLLDVLAGHDGASLAEISRTIHMSKPAAYAILQTYLARGLVADFGEGPQRRYRLGLGLARLGDAALRNLGLVDVAMPELRALTAELGLTSRIAIIDDGHAVVVGRVDGPGAVRFDAALGRRELLHCSAVGKALLAEKTEAEVRAIIRRHGLPRRTPNTITQTAKLIARLREVNALGYAVEDEEDCEGVGCVGACVFDHHGAPVAAISVTGLKGRDFEKRTGELGNAVKACANRISARLGSPAKRDFAKKPQN